MKPLIPRINTNFKVPDQKWISFSNQVQRTNYIWRKNNLTYKNAVRTYTPDSLQRMLPTHVWDTSDN